MSILEFDSVVNPRLSSSMPCFGKGMAASDCLPVTSMHRVERKHGVLEQEC